MTSDLVRRTEHVLRPDPARVITTELIPSAEGPPTAPTRMGALLHRVLSLSDEQVAHSQAVLRERGNMSSTTLPHIWARMLADEAIPDGALVASVAFGPGLTFVGNLMRKGS